MSVAMALTAVSRCAVTPMDHTTASATVVMNSMMMAIHVEVNGCSLYVYCYVSLIAM